MGNIMDYISWRGDLSFAQSPFNEVDNLILACFSYVNLDRIPAVTRQKGIELKKLVKEFKKLHTIKELEADKSFIRLAPFMMFEMAESVRFGKCVIRNYANEIVTEAEQQFSAVEIVLEDGTSYVSFRGTDDTIIGWKEDFNLSTGVVPAQERAVEYMERISDKASGMLRVGGHSKGGNLAIYAAVKAKPSLKRRIIAVYNNDGPGFDREMIESEEYRQMLPKIKTIVPEHSVVGMLLEHEEKYMIVKSSQTGIMQHDAMSWQVLGAFLVKAKKLSAQSRRLNKALSSWINSVDNERREEFVETLFGLLYASGAKNLSDVSADRLRSTREVIRQYAGLDKDSRTLIKNMLLSLTDKISKARFEK